MHLPRVPESGVITLHFYNERPTGPGPRPRPSPSSSPAPKRLVMVDAASTWSGRVGVARRVARDLRTMGNRVLLVYPPGTSGITDGVSADYVADGIRRERPDRIVFVGAESVDPYTAMSGIKGHVVEGIKTIARERWDLVKMVAGIR